MWMTSTLAMSPMSPTLVSPTTALAPPTPLMERDRPTLPLTIPHPIMLLPTTQPQRTTAPPLLPTMQLQRTMVQPPLPMPPSTTPSSKWTENPRLIDTY